MNWDRQVHVSTLQEDHAYDMGGIKCFFICPALALVISFCPILGWYALLHNSLTLHRGYYKDECGCLVVHVCPWVSVSGCLCQGVYLWVSVSV